MESYESVVNDVLHINLTEKYRNERKRLLADFNEWVRNKNLELKSKDDITGVVVGQIVEMLGGFNKDIRYTTEVFGFIDGKCHILWDCWWFGIDLVEREYVVKIN